MSKSTIIIICLLALCTLIRSQGVPITANIPNCREQRTEAGTGNTICAFCNIGYAPRSDRLVCNKCANGCSECALSVTLCSACFPGFALVGQSCQSCASGCTTCSGLPTNCQGCSSGYSLVGSTCVKCPANCAACNSNNFCIRCDARFFALNGVCTSCLPSCFKCQDSKTCQECSTGYDLKKEGGADVCKMGAALTVIYYIIFGIVFCIVAVVVIVWIIRAVQASAENIGNNVHGSFHAEANMQPVVYDGGSSNRRQEAPMQPVVYDGDRY